MNKKAMINPITLIILDRSNFDRLSTLVTDQFLTLAKTQFTRQLTNRIREHRASLVVRYARARYRATGRAARETECKQGKRGADCSHSERQRLTEPVSL